jgi:hypothetical protein
MRAVAGSAGRAVAGPALLDLLPRRDQAGNACGGRVRLRYANSTGQFQVPITSGNLHWYKVSTGCLGLVNDGDPATLSRAYAVTPKQAITSP